MSYNFCNGKTLWPELLGVDGEIAAATIERENPHVNAIIMLEGTGGIPRDYRCDRVKIWVEKKHGRVVRVPRVM
ncbi:hypothetical protein ACHQM5_014421 [Ranunculus cassubicifolius]